MNIVKTVQYLLLKMPYEVIEEGNFLITLFSGNESWIQKFLSAQKPKFGFFYSPSDGTIKEKATYKSLTTPFFFRI